MKMSWMDGIYIVATVGNLIRALGEAPWKWVVSWVVGMFFVETIQDFPSTKDWLTRLKPYIVFCPKLGGSRGEMFPGGKTLLLWKDRRLSIIRISPLPSIIEEKSGKISRMFQLWTLESSHKSILNLIYRDDFPVQRVFSVTGPFKTSGTGRAVTTLCYKTHIPFPGRGCPPASWELLLGQAQKMASRRSDCLLKGRPAGAAYLLVGPPGSGKSTMAAHLAGKMSSNLYLPQIVGTFGVLGIPVDWASEPRFKRTEAGCDVFSSVCVCAVDDVDRLLRSEGGEKVQMADLLGFMDRMMDNPNILIFTANSIEGMDPAFLSRVSVIYVPAPTKHTITSHLKDMLDCDDLEAARIASGLGDGPLDLRQVRRALGQQGEGGDFLEAWRRVQAAEQSSLDLAKEDGDKFVTG